MIAQLRRRHFYMWLIVAPLIVIGAIVAYLEAPKFPVENYTEAEVNFPELVRSVVSENYMFDLKKNFNGETELDVMQISTINPVSELLIIQYSLPGSEKILRKEVGLIGGDKVYSFNLGIIEPPFKISVMDTIKRQSLADVEF